MLEIDGFSKFHGTFDKNPWIFPLENLPSPWIFFIIHGFYPCNLPKSMDLKKICEIIGFLGSPWITWILCISFT